MISPIHESEFETRILHGPEIRSWRTVQDSNPRLRLRKPEGYPDYPNSPLQLASRGDPSSIRRMADDHHPR